MTQHAAIALALTVALGGFAVFNLLAQADRTVVEGPGFKMEKREGVFGTSERTYNDALGNTYTKKKGLFGQTEKKSRIFGSEVTQRGDDITVKGPNGKPIIERKRSGWFGLGKPETRIDTQGFFDFLKGDPAGTP